MGGRISNLVGDGAMAGQHQVRAGLHTSIHLILLQLLQVCSHTTWQQREREKERERKGEKERKGERM